MNRPLKFRAWTGSSMEYRVVVGSLGAFYVEGLDPKDSASMSPFNTIYGDGTPIEQFTGLLDKNGKEIWEGDIVLWEHGAGDSGKGVVHFSECGFYTGEVRQGLEQYYPPNDVQGYPLGSMSLIATVIGNIHENPNLIESGAKEKSAS